MYNFIVKIPLTQICTRITSSIELLYDITFIGVVKEIHVFEVCVYYYIIYLFEQNI